MSNISRREVCKRLHRDGFFKESSQRGQFSEDGYPDRCPGIPRDETLKGTILEAVGGRAVPTLMDDGSSWELFDLVYRRSNPWCDR
jgi:hypothetical protein